MSSSDDAAIIAAATAIIRAAPPGHVDSVVENVQHVLGTKKNHSKTILEFQNTEWKELKGGGGSTTDDGTDPGMVLTQKEQAEHPLATKLQEKLKAHHKANISSSSSVPRISMQVGKNTTTTADDTDMDTEQVSNFLVKTYVEKIDTPNKCSCSWTASWNIDDTDVEVAKLSGNVLVRSYSHEENTNIQLTITKEFPFVWIHKNKDHQNDGTATPTPTPTSSCLADGIYQQICVWESIVLEIVGGAMKDSVTGDHLKSVRRILPITKQKMNWDANAHRSVQTLKQSAPEAKSKVKYNK